MRTTGLENRTALDWVCLQGSYYKKCKWKTYSLTSRSTQPVWKHVLFSLPSVRYLLQQLTEQCAACRQSWRPGRDRQEYRLLGEGGRPALDHSAGSDKVSPRRRWDCLMSLHVGLCLLPFPRGWLAKGSPSPRTRAPLSHSCVSAEGSTASFPEANLPSHLLPPSILPSVRQGLY